MCVQIVVDTVPVSHGHGSLGRQGHGLPYVGLMYWFSVLPYPTREDPTYTTQQLPWICHQYDSWYGHHPTIIQPRLHVVTQSYGYTPQQLNHTIPYEQHNIPYELFGAAYEESGGLILRREKYG